MIERHRSRNPAEAEIQGLVMGKELLVDRMGFGVRLEGAEGQADRSSSALQIRARACGATREDASFRPRFNLSFLTLQTAHNFLFSWDALAS